MVQIHIVEVGQIIDHHGPQCRHGFLKMAVGNAKAAASTTHTNHKIRLCLISLPV